MNNYYKNIITFYYLRRQQNQGFTLLELLVVAIIMGILVAVAIPNFINQIGKSRETEGKIGLGTLARSQQAYHFEKQSFANSLSILNPTSQVNSKYYNYQQPNPVDSNHVQHKAIATNPNSDQVRNYAIGVYFNAGGFEMVLCQGDFVGDDVNVPNNTSGLCDGIKIE